MHITPEGLRNKINTIVRNTIVFFDKWKAERKQRAIRKMKKQKYF